MDFTIPQKCLRVLKIASTNKSICADIGTCVVYCGQWACPKKPNGTLTEFDATDNAIISDWFHLGWKDEILTVLKSAENLAPPAMEAGSHLMLPESQGSSTPNISGFLLVTAWIFSMKWYRDFQSMELCSSLFNTPLGKSLKTTESHTKTACKNVLAQPLWNWSATVALINTFAVL